MPAPAGPPAPLVAVDAPSLMYRAFFALPTTITDGRDRPVNALLGTTNLILQVVEQQRPRAVVMCWGPESALYRTQAYPAYHADRPPMPAELLGRAMARLSATCTSAVTTLGDLLKAESESVRLGAARSILDLALRWRSEVDLAERLDRVEGWLEAMGDEPEDGKVPRWRRAG